MIGTGLLDFATILGVTTAELLVLEFIIIQTLTLEYWMIPHYFLQ
jgi:hypothetical protein